MKNHGGRRAGSGRRPLSDEPATQVKVLLPESAAARLQQQFGKGRVAARLRALALADLPEPGHKEYAIWREDEERWEIGLYSCLEEAQWALECAQAREPGVAFKLGIWPHPPS